MMASITELEHILAFLRGSDRLELSDLVQAGELTYLNQTSTVVIKKIIEDYATTNHFAPLMSSCFIPIMYQLKRHQSLDDFIRTFQYEYLTSVAESALSFELSLRMIIHLLMLKSDFALSRKLITLLSKRNPVPFVQPRILVDNAGTTAEYEFVSDIIHVWDYSKPTVLSFGIGTCPGKATLLNRVFLTLFEQENDSIYFNSTIDIDFGYNFQPRRATNIAHTHGSMDRRLLEEVHSLFDGFLIHVEHKYLLAHSDEVRDMIDVVKGNGKYVLLLVRECALNTIDAVEKLTKQQFPDIRCSALPDISNDNPRYQTKLIAFQKHIWEVDRMPTDPRSNARTSIETILRRIIARDYGNQLDRLYEIIDPLKKQLSAIAKNEQLSQQHFNQYLGFSHLCSLKVALTNSRFVNVDDGAKVMELRRNISESNRKLKESLKTNNELLRLFMEILREQNRFICLDLISTHIREDPIRLVTVAEMAKQLPVYLPLSLEVLWRNAILCSQNFPPKERDHLCEDYYRYIRAGFPFEIVDGDNLNFEHEFLSKTLAKLRGQHTLVISILGPQNSGKSTLLNYMFGTLFDVRDGRCTRGIYGSLIKANLTNFKQILLLDTEGLFSVEGRNEEYDRRIVLFCLAVSHVVLINVAKDFDSSVRNIVLASIDSLNKMGVTRIPRPILHFVINQQADPARCHGEASTLMASLEGRTSDNENLQDRIDLRLEYFHSLPAAFKNEGKSSTSSPGMSSAERTSCDFLDATQNLCKEIFQSIEQRPLNSIIAFADILQWLLSSRTVFQVSQEYPDLTYYHDIHERRVDQDVHQFIRRYLSETFSRAYRQEIIDESLGKTKIEVESSFTQRKRTVEDKSMEDLENYLKSVQASQRIRERNENFFRMQINQIFAGLESTTIATMERHNLKKSIDTANASTDTLINDVINKKDVGSLETVLKNFNGKFSQQKELIQNQFHFETWLEQSKKHIYTFYRIYETNSTAELSQISEHFPFLEKQIRSRKSRDEMKRNYGDYFVKQSGQSVSVVEFLPFDPKVPLYTSNMTEGLRYLNKSLLRRRLRDFMSQPTFDSKVHGSTDEFLKDVRDKLHIEKLNSETADDERYLSLRSSITELVHHVIEAVTVTNSDSTRPIELELIQGIVGLVNTLTDEIDRELIPFCVKMSRPLKIHFHSCVIILLSHYYYEDQQRYFNDTLRQCDECHKEKEQLIRTIFEQHLSVDDSHAINFLKQFKDYLVLRAKKECREIAWNVAERYKHLNRKYVQDACDGRLLSETDEKWIDDYLADPRGRFEEHFLALWKPIKKEIDQEMIKKKSQYAENLIKCFQCFPNFWRTLSGLGEISVVVRDLFQSTQLIERNRREDHVNKQVCLYIIFYRLATKENICQPIAIAKETFYLTAKAETAFRSITRQEATTTSSDVLSKGVQDEQERIRQEWNALELTFDQIDEFGIFNKFRDRVLGCSALCPCCRRPCDVDHTKFQSGAGTPKNEHQCKSGHSLRAMNGYKMETTDEASLKTCEQIRDDDTVMIDGIRDQWSHFKSRHSQWNFNSDLDSIRSNSLYGKFLVIWEKIGPKICEKYQMKFVKHNSHISHSYDPLHYILLLDGSGSMVGARWENLKNAVQNFIKVRRGLLETDLITIIIFEATAEVYFSKVKLKEVNLETLPPPAGMTNFRAAFEKVYDCMSETKKHFSPTAVENQYGIVFMTDGESDEDPMERLLKLKTDHGEMIRQFWILALSEDITSFKTLESIKKTMDGTFYDIDKSENLKSKYAEVACSHVLVRASPH